MTIPSLDPCSAPRPQATLARHPGASALVALLVACFASPVSAAGLAITDWTAKACTTGAPDQPTFCPYSAVGTVSNSSQTSPGVNGPDPAQPSTASATIGGGVSAYQTSGGWNGATGKSGSAANGFDYGTLSRAQYTLNGVNTDPTPTNLSWTFTILGGGLDLDITEFFALGDHYPQAEIASILQITTPTRVLANWQWHATLTGVNSDINVIFEDNLFDPGNLGIGKPTPQVTLSSSQDNRTKVGHVTFDPFSRVLQLGPLNPGELFTVSYQIWAYTYTGEHNPFPDPQKDEPVTNSSAWVTDPFGLTGDPIPGTFPATGFELNGQSLESLTAVPAPGAGWLTVTAIAAVVAYRQGRTGRPSG